jgi:hypothetical protein
MTETATRILRDFATLPPEEQSWLLAELVRQCDVTAELDLSDAALVSLADSLFVSLDARETDDDSPATR